ncbi:MAG: hypothetical protein II920_01740 [Clostridia bacterium]|nr:hypothetical protein [Clostridia bacterium]
MREVEFISNGGNIDEKEKQAYINRGIEKYGRALERVEVKLDGDYADISYHTSKVPFERIRRITGYLVGTMDKWNNAKRSEEHDRVKHSV